MLNNNVTLIGRLTKDVEVRKTQQGTSVVQFDLAVDRFKKEDGADFIRCQVWKQSADYLGKYASKGTLIALNGRISTRSFDNKQGQKVYVTEVIADSVKILVSPQNGQSNNYQQPQQTYQQTLTNDGYDMTGYSTFSSLDIASDDLPFY